LAPLCASVYDELNQLVSRTWQGGGIDSARIDFGYSARGERTSIVRSGHVTGTQPIGRSVFDYDASGRLTGIQHLDASE
jgi:YD repeat-containing protein